MILRQRKILTTLTGLLLSLVAIFTFSLSVSADPLNNCTNNDAGGTRDRPDQCVYDNYNQLPGGTSGNVRGVSQEEYFDMVWNCEGRGVTWLNFGDADVAPCSNAVSGCLQYAIDTDRCNDGTLMANTAGGLCSTEPNAGGAHGNVFGNDGECLYEINKPSFVDASNIDIPCDVRQGNEAADQAACDEQKVQAQQTCRDNVLGGIEADHKTSNGSGQVPADTWTQEGLNKYNQCLNEEVVTSAHTAKECRDRGGTPQADAQGGYSGCTLEEQPGYCELNYSAPGQEAEKEACIVGQTGANCEEAYTDPALRQACENGRGNPLEEDPDPDGSLCATKEQKAADPSNAVLQARPTCQDTQETRCGEARVNLLACGEEGGNVALNRLLRIIVVVLSFAVGLAAVGGLAWASVLYAKAQDNESNVSEAKTLIRNIIIGLLLYVFLVALINWLVPGTVVGQ